MGYKGKIKYEPFRPADVMRHKADIGLARKLIGYEPKTEFKAGIRSTVTWYKELQGKKARP
jgi:nucleoside-diphosphate-sugar epimerase